MAQQSMFQVGSTIAFAVSNTALNLEDIGFSAAELKVSDVLRVSVEDAAIRETAGVDDPTDSLGHGHEAGEEFQLVTRPVLRRTRFIRRDGDDALCQFSLFSWSPQ